MRRRRQTSNPLAYPLAFVLMRYRATGAFVVRRKGGGQVLQVAGLGDPKLHETIAVRCKKELEKGQADGTKFPIKVLKAEHLGSGAGSKK